MPVNYVAPGPISMAGIYGRNNGGGGGGGQVVQLHDDSMRQQNQLALAGLQGTIENDQINQRGAIQSQLSQQAAQLDAWQYHQKVTEQEAMQLRQDQNAIAAVDADTSLSPLEKMQAKTRIKSRIDWVSERQKRDMQQAQVEMYQAHASQYKQQAALEEERIKNSAALLANKTKTITDPAKASDLAEIVTRLGIDPKTPQGIAMMDKIATEEGWTATYPVNEKGVMGAKPIFGFGTQGGAGEAWAAKPGGKGGDETAHQNVAHYAEAHKLAVEEAKLAGETTVSPAKIQEHLDAISGRTPGGQKEKAAKNYTETLARADTSIQQTMEDNTLPPGLKETRVKTMSAIKQLMTQYPPGSRPKAIAKKIEGLQKYYDQLASVKIGAPAAEGQQQQGQPADQGQSSQPAPRELRDDRPVFSSGITPAEATGNAARNAWDVLVQSAPSSAALRSTGPVIKKKLDDLGELLGFTKTARGD